MSRNNSFRLPVSLLQCWQTNVVATTTAGVGVAVWNPISAIILRLLFCFVN